MEFHLDYSLEASSEIDNSLYDWCIREVDKNGNQVGRDQIPWQWGLHFRISELSYSYDVEGEGEDALKSLEDMSEDNADKLLLKSSERIFARLEPETSFSMLGAEREINNFSLKVFKADTENCFIRGGVSFTAEVDFYDETVGDFVQVYLAVTSERFDAMSELVKLRCLNEASFMLSRVHGFYADWSPGISTNRVKVLARGKEQRLNVSDDFGFKPLRLGHVGEFRLHLGSQQKFMI